MDMKYRIAEYYIKVSQLIYRKYKIPKAENKKFIEHCVFCGTFLLLKFY